MDGDPKRAEGNPVVLPTINDTTMLEAEFACMVAHMRHSLRSVLELGRELAVSRNLYELIDIVLLNLMGQLGTSKAALWMLPAASPRSPVPMRHHGVSRRVASILGETLVSPCALRILEEGRPVAAKAIASALSSEDRRYLEESKLGLISPIQVHGKLTGFAAVGDRISGDPFRASDLQAVQSSLGMLGVAMENARLYNNLLERNRQLRQAADDMKELDRLKSQFVNNVNHELRTPLTVIIAYLETLRSGRMSDSDRQQFLEIAIEESGKLMSLLERLLDFSDLSRNELEVELQAGDVRSLLLSFYNDRLPGILDGLREFNSRICCGPVIAQCDFRRVRQILDAVLDNAVKFTPQGAHIELAAETIEEDDKRWLQIGLSDDGPGIDPEQIPGLFDSFRQADGSTTRTIGGMGIGLSLARSLAQRMGGDLRILSEAGKGFSLSLLLPLQSNESSADQREAA